MDDDVVTYWCKLRSGELMEHVTSPYVGHSGHVLCVPVKVASPSTQKAAPVSNPGG